MGQSLVRLYAHLIFSTKHRAPLIIREVRDPLHAYIGGTLKNLECRPMDASFRGFHWQGGYGLFSVSASRVEAVKAYIRGQEEHHRKETFQDEFRRFLKEYGVPYDERYVWD